MMQPLSFLPVRSLSRALVFCLLALGSSGCVSVEMFKNSLAYEPQPLASRVEARANLDVAHALSPEARDLWRSWGNGPETIGNWEAAVRSVMVDDLLRSGLFASAQVGGSGSFDYLVRVRSQDLRSPDRYSAELQICDWNTKNVIFTSKHEVPVEGGRFDSFKDAIKLVMSQLKADVLAEFAKGRLLPHAGRMPQHSGAPVPTLLPGPEMQPQI